MEKYLKVLSQMQLFNGISSQDIINVLGCLTASESEYKKGEFIFLSGSPANFVGVVLCGNAQIIQEDCFGNRDIVASLSVGDLFGEAFSCAGVAEFPLSCLTISDAYILKIDCQKLMSVCSNSCTFHSRIIYNLLKIVSAKNVLLSKKINIISKRTTREKLVSYLSEQALLAQSKRFTLRLNRQELADYLAVDRSAMCVELKKLAALNKISYRKNDFIIND